MESECMGNKLIKIVLSLALIAGMIGIAAAAFETIGAIYDGTNIITTVGNLQMDKYYQLRYYPPGTFTCNSGSNNNDCTAEIDADPNPSGTILGTEWCTGDDPVDAQSKCQFPYQATHTESFQPNSNGVWAIGLFHGGQGGAAITSFKVSTNVDVPIPEFPTVALPIAAVIGLLFFFKQRKKE